MNIIHEGDTVILSLTNRRIMGVVKWLSKNGQKATLEVKQGSKCCTWPDMDTHNLRAVAS